MSKHTQVIASQIRRAAAKGNTRECVVIAELCRQHGMNYNDIAEIASQAGLERAEWDALLEEGGECPVCGESITQDEGDVYAQCSNGHKSCSGETF